MKSKILSLAVVLSLLVGAAVSVGAATFGGIQGNTANDSFQKAKRMLEREVYKSREERVTLYCGYSYDEQKNILLPDSFSTPSALKRAKRVEWEHVVPAENFGRTFREWREGDAMCVDKEGKPFTGRNCAEKVNMTYRYMQADMYNLYPAVGAVNAIRSNFQYSMLPSNPVTFGSCEMKIDERSHRAEPPNAAKGRVARASLYMDAAYPAYRLSDQQRKLFEAWDKMYPVDQWECTRTMRIEKLQKNENPFVKRPCQAKGMWR